VESYMGFRVLPMTIKRMDRTEICLASREI
jgi:hypothetical protein